MPEDPPAVDSLSKGAPPPKQEQQEVLIPAKLTKRMKTIIIVFVSLPYVIYVGWCLFLLAVLPSPSGAFQEFLVPGVIVCAVAAVVLFLMALLATRHILGKKVVPFIKMMSMLRVVGFALPGIALGIIVPLIIIQEPHLGMDITDPTDPELFVAPLSVTFSVEHAVDILRNRGLKALDFSWDFDGDGEENDKTIVPVATGLYDRPGGYNVTVTMTLQDGTQRTVVRRVEIPSAVFSVSPLRPGVEESVRFSVRQLLADGEKIREVQWDFDDDGIIDTVSDLPDAAYTYLRTGKVKVSALVTLENQVQRAYERVVEIYEPQPPPFPVKLISEPENLMSPAPFGTIFRIESDIPIEDVIWDFGDGEKTKGDRVGHNFQKRGVFQVTAVVHAQDGQIAELSKVVRIVESLKLPDLEFEGNPQFVKKDTMRGGVPVSVDLTAQTSMPLIDFKWEAPGATSIGSTDGTLQAIYRRPGKYTITLIAQDPDGKVVRRPLSLIVDPPTSDVTIRMTPEGGTAPLLVRFDASETVIPSEEITGFEWKFGDNKNAAQQRGAQVEYLFEKPGTFKITLTTYTTSGKTYSADKTIVVRAPILDACILPSRTEGEAPLGVSFDMSCTTGNPTSILWNFGDGAESEDKHPVHVFEAAGVYKVLLTLEDDLGTTSKEIVTITVE